MSLKIHKEKINSKQVKKLVILMTDIFGKDRKKVLKNIFLVDSTKDLDMDIAIFLINKLEKRQEKYILHIKQKLDLGAK